MKLMLTVMCAAVVMMSGCSLALQGHLPDGTIRSAKESTHCSASRVLPWTDMGILSGLLTTAATLSAVNNGTFDHPRSSDALTFATGSAAFASMIYLASADVGFKRARACGQADALEHPIASR